MLWPYAWAWKSLRSRTRDGGADVADDNPSSAGPMPDLTITRFCYAPDGTFGSMTIDGYDLYTIEQPWNNNKKGASCIPEGLYTCVPSFYHRGGYKAVEITGVPGGRTRILFHKANWPHQLRGCIAPVSDWGCVNDMIGGPDSGNAFTIFMDHYGDHSFVLLVTHTTIDFEDHWL